MIDYIPNKFGKEWIAAAFEAKRGVHVPLSYIDINEGDLYGATVFSQIMYWHEPSKETGKTRLTIKKDGYYWLAKNHSEWFVETRMKMATVRKVLDRLKERGLIIYELHGFNGEKTPYIRVNWDEFERRMNLWLKLETENIRESGYADTVSVFAVTVPLLPNNRVGGCYQITGTLLPNNEPNTETTTETTNNTTASAVEAVIKEEEADASDKKVSNSNSLVTKTKRAAPKFTREFMLSIEQAIAQCFFKGDISDKDFYKATGVRIRAVRSQLLETFPDTTPDEICEMAKDYFKTHIGVKELKSSTKIPEYMYDYRKKAAARLEKQKKYESAYVSPDSDEDLNWVASSEAY